MNIDEKQGGLETVSCVIDDVSRGVEILIVRLDEAGQILLEESGPWDAADMQIGCAIAVLEAARQIIAQIQDTLQNDIDADKASIQEAAGPKGA